MTKSHTSPKKKMLSVRNLVKKEVSEAVRPQVLRLKSQQLRTMQRSAKQASTQTRTDDISVMITAVKEMTFAQGDLAAEVKMLRSGMAQAGKTHRCNWVTGGLSRSDRAGEAQQQAQGDLSLFFYKRKSRSESRSEGERARFAYQSGRS